MDLPTMNEVTQILHAIGQGDRHAAADLMPLLYDELRKLAAQQLARESAGQTLQPTALVHEAYVRLIGTEDANCWDNRGHFFGAAAEAMRRILIENARRKMRVKHGGEMVRVELSDDISQLEEHPERLIELDAASNTQVDNMRELLENALTHARGHGFRQAEACVAAQYYPGSGRVRLAVVDDGCDQWSSPLALYRAEQRFADGRPMPVLRRESVDESGATDR